MTLASLGVRADEVVNLPVRTHFARVEEHGGSSAKVLPIMGIDTDFTVMIILTIRAPNGLEVEHVEIHINNVLFDQFNRKFTFIVRKGTVFLIFTRRGPHLEIGRAELGLILVWMIKLLDTVMGPLTVVALRTVLIFSDHVRTDFRLVCSKRPSSVLIKVMIVWTALQVMILRVQLARLNFEGK